MKRPTPFFAGFHRLLFGRPQRSVQEKLQNQAELLRRASLCRLAQLFEPWLPPQRLRPPAGSRRRSFPLPVTFWAFLSQTLSPQSPCREIVRKVQAWCAIHKQPLPRSNTGAYCRARKRLDPQHLHQVHRQGADQLQRNVSTDQLWLGRHVKVVDGTGLSMPDTAKNQAAFPQPTAQKPGCGFPVAKIVACFCLHGGALLH
jgi:hypothetical protein